MRLLSYNIHKGVGWKPRKSTFKQLFANIIELDPDIICLQEILKSQFAQFPEQTWPYCVFGKNANYRNDQQGNAIISKIPIQYIKNLNLSMHRYENRGILHTVAEANRLHILCVHLGLFARDRRNQINKIIEYVTTMIPDEADLIISGDFNDWSGYATWPLKEKLKLDEAFLANHKSHARTYPAWSPIFKLDRVYYRGLQLKQSHRLIKNWKYLSDHLGIEVNFEPI